MRPDQMPRQPFPDDADELAGLPADVRAHVENMDARNTVNGSWNACRAELLRLVRENAELRKTFEAKTVHVSIPTATMYAEFENYARPFKERTERAEAELAALKREIAEAPIVLCEVKDGADEDDDDIGTFYMPRAYWNVPVALLPVGGEG